MVHLERTMNFDDLRVFVIVAQHGGITSGANALNVAKSNVSQSVTRLEKELGVRLFERSSRRVALTREGLQLLPRVKSLLAEAENLREEASKTKSLPRGTVRIAVPPALGCAVLERLIPQLHVRYPDIALVVASNYMMDDLQNPAFDFAIRVGDIHDKALVASKAGSFSRILVSSPQHAGFHVQSVDSLSELPLLAFSQREPRVNWTLCATSEPGRRVIVDQQAYCAVHDFEVLMRLARAGHGIAEVPEFMARKEIRQGRLQRVLPDWQSPAVDVMFAYRAGVSRISRIAAVLEVARDVTTQLLGDNV